MKIYTKTGDRGETGLFGGGRVAKDSPRIEAYGVVDELNSIVGIVRAFKPGSAIDKVLRRIQEDLFILGADLATPRSEVRSAIPRIDQSHVLSLERIIDKFELRLPPLKTFILPGGTPVASHLHLARTVCRRAERCLVHLSRSEDVGPQSSVYLNRLSDLFFVLARYANHVEKKKETQWTNPSRGR